MFIEMLRAHCPPAAGSFCCYLQVLSRGGDVAADQLEDTTAAQQQRRCGWGEGGWQAGRSACLPE